MKVYINGELTPLVIQGITTSSEVSIEKPLDVSTFRYISYTNSEPLEKDTLIKIEANAYFIQWMLVQSDLVEKHSKIVNAYIHTVNCIECTSYLDRFQMSNPIYTLKEYRYTVSNSIIVHRPTTMLEYLNMAIMNAEPLTARSCRFSFAPNVLTEFLSVPSEDIFLKTPCTLRNVLDRMFSVKNYRCYVAKIEDFSNIVIGIRSLNPTGQLIEFDDVINETSVLNSQYRYGKTVTELNNAISQNVVAVHGWDTLRPTGSNLTIVGKTDYGFSKLLPIQEVLHFYIKVTMNVVEQSDDPANVYVLTIDLNKDGDEYGIIDSELYDLMDEDKQAMFIQFTRKTNQFGEGVYKSWLGIVQSKIKLMRQYVLDNVINTYDSNFASTGGMDVVSIETLVEKTPGYLNNPQWMLLCNSRTYDPYDITTDQYKIEYIPYFNTRVSLSNPNIKDTTTQYSNQNEQNLSIERYSKQFQEQINQTGNPVRVIDCVAFDWIDVKDIGDYTSENYVITSRDISFGEGFYKCHYVLTKYFLNSQLKASLDREKRLYDIPLESVEQEINVTDYIELSTTAKSSLDITFLGDAGCKAILKGFEQQNHPIIKKIVALTSASQANNGSYVLDANRFIFGRSIVWVWEMFDNYSYDLGVAERIIGGRAIAYNPYVNTNDGTIHVDADSESRFTKDNEHSFIVMAGVTSEINGAYNDVSSDVDFFDENGGAQSYMFLSYYKDPYVALRGTIQGEFISNNEKIIIGDSIAKYSNLNQQMSNVDLYLWSSDRKYTYMDDKCIGTKGSTISVTTNTSNNSLTIDLTSLPTGSKAYAIGTSSGELLFAVNDITVDTIYFSIHRDRN